jgi:hypothetical protein
MISRIITNLAVLGMILTEPKNDAVTPVVTT